MATQSATPGITNGGSSVRKVRYVDLLDKLEEAFNRRPQFDAPEDEEKSVTGSELVDWFAGWREETKVLTLTARAKLEGTTKTSAENEIAEMKTSLAEARFLVGLLVEAWPRSGQELADRVNQLRIWAGIPA